jgi:general secretion pathway protein A
MYTAFYGLREKPFSLTPDPRYLFLASSHREALAHLLYGIEQGEGFIAVTGEVGTGKTTLCRTLLERLGNEADVAYIFNPTLTGDELLRAIMVELGMLTTGLSRAELIAQLNEYLLEQKRRDRRVLLIVDEAQNLSTQTLEEIRLLSNLETSTSKLIQILLFGQPELDEKLESQELRQLRQRISVRWSLDTLSSSETAEYVKHRLRVGAEGECELFSDAALREVHRRSRGVPRLVNLLCDRALLAGYADEAREITAEHVSGAAREILGARRRKLLRKGRWRRSVAAVAVLLGAAAGAFAIQGWRTGEFAQEPHAVSAGPSPVGTANREVELLGDSG